MEDELLSCGHCHRDRMRSELVALSSGALVCRDGMSCDIAKRPWKAPGLTLDEKNKLRREAGLHEVSA